VRCTWASVRETVERKEKSKLFQYEVDGVMPTRRNAAASPAITIARVAKDRHARRP
jgi:hypothetical protein